MRSRCEFTRFLQHIRNNQTCEVSFPIEKYHATYNPNIQPWTNKQGYNGEPSWNPNFYITSFMKTKLLLATYPSLNRVLKTCKPRIFLYKWGEVLEVATKRNNHTVIHHPSSSRCSVAPCSKSKTATIRLFHSFHRAHLD